MKRKINQEIENLKKELENIRDYRNNIPDYIKKENELIDLKRRYFEKNDKRINEISIQISSLEKEKIKLKEEKEKAPKELEEWLKYYCKGVNFGYSDPKIRWFSDDLRFVVVTFPGSMAGGGTAMGSSGYYYSGAEHILFDRNDKRNWLGNNSGIMKFSGRFNNDKKKQVMEKIQSIISNE